MLKEKLGDFIDRTCIYSYGIATGWKKKTATTTNKVSRNGTFKQNRIAPPMQCLYMYNTMQTDIKSHLNIKRNIIIYVYFTNSILILGIQNHKLYYLYVNFVIYYSFRLNIDKYACVCARVCFGCYVMSLNWTYGWAWQWKCFMLCSYDRLSAKTGWRA